MSKETDLEEGRMTERDEQGGDEEIATCHMCGQTFPKQEELSKHLMDEHGDDGLPSPDPGEPHGSESQKP
jgi:uncharacterized C2H2 Zn-finger protein